MEPWLDDRFTDIDPVPLLTVNDVECSTAVSLPHIQLLEHYRKHEKRSIINGARFDFCLPVSKMSQVTLGQYVTSTTAHKSYWYVQSSRTSAVRKVTKQTGSREK